MREIINLHIGQTGIQLGNACWKLFCLEHGIQLDGTLDQEQHQQHNEEEKEAPKTFFSIKEDEKIRPRQVYIDTDCESIDEVKNGPLSSFFSPDSLISGKENASSCFSQGRFLAKQNQDEYMDAVRKIAEGSSSQNIQGFMIQAGLGGGTGSGLTSHLLSQLSNDYPGKKKLGFCILPFSRLSTSIVEPYNTVLALHFSQINQLDVSCMIENEACYDVWYRRKTQIAQPSYANLNRLIAQVVSSWTASLRFNGNMLWDLADFQTNLIPYIRINSIISSYSSSTFPKFQPASGIMQMTLENFQLSSYFCKFIDQQFFENERNMSICMQYRCRNIVPKDIRACQGTMRTKRHIKFVDWGPAGFKIGNVYREPPRLPIFEDPDTDKMKYDLCSLSNNTGIRHIYAKNLRKFDRLFSKRAYIHWFLSDGMEQDEFVQARNDIEDLLEDYQEILQNSE